MKKTAVGKIVFVVAVLAIVFWLFTSYTSKKSSDTENQWEKPEKQLQDAVEIAVSALYQQSSSPGTDYTLTAVQQIIVNGQYIWLITFKPTKFLPEDPSKGPITMGGEVFVNVDLSTKKTEIRYGE
jgi:hypothetical protein